MKIRVFVGFKIYCMRLINAQNMEYIKLKRTLSGLLNFVVK